MKGWKKRMSEVKVDTIEELQQEYSRKCAMAGDLQYKIECFKADLDTINGQMRDINQRAAKINADKEAAAPVEAEVVQ